MTRISGIATLTDALSRRLARDERREADAAPVHAADADLARACVAGEETAQALFSQRYTRLVYALCRRRGLGREAAEDVTQDVLADAIRGLPRFRGASRLSSWIFSIAIRRLCDRHRSPAERTIAAGRPGDDSFPGGEPADTGWEARLAERDRARVVRDTVESLAEPARTILLGFYLAELSVAEIAAELELPVGTVKSHLHRGRAAVRSRLGVP